MFLLNQDKYVYKNISKLKKHPIWALGFEIYTKHASELRPIRILGARLWHTNGVPEEYLHELRPMGAIQRKKVFQSFNIPRLEPNINNNSL